jgi:hypothetical protein
MNSEAMNARIDGWGPDFCEVTVSCPRAECGWMRDWSTDRPVVVTLAVVAAAVDEHLTYGHVPL